MVDRLPPRGPRTVHPSRARRPGRLARTILLGTLAVVLALVWLAREMDLDREALLGYLGLSVLFITIPIAFGLLGALLLRLLKRLRRSG